MGTLRGVILAGGTGTRLRPLTEAGVNKHLVATGQTPMIDLPIRTLLSAGIRDITVVAGGDAIGGFLTYLGAGGKYGAGVDFTLKSQDHPGGIAEAFLRTESVMGPTDKIVAILGDNVFGPFDLHAALKRMKWEDWKTAGAIFLKEVPDPERFGVAVFDDAGKLVDIVEKPKVPPSNLAVTGLYVYSAHAYGYAKQLKPSGRGELEVTDLNRAILRDGRLVYGVLDTFWRDAGTHATRQEVEDWLRAHPEFQEQVLAQRRSA